MTPVSQPILSKNDSPLSVQSLPNATPEGPMADPIASFSVANINPGTVKTEFMLSIMALMGQEREYQQTIDPLQPRIRFDQFYAHFAGPYLDDERNRCVQWYLNHTESQYLIFVDSDIAPEPHHFYDLIDTMVKSDVELLSGVYYSPLREGLCPVIYHWMTDDGDEMHLVPYTRKALKADASNHEFEIVPVDATGAGFLGISRTLLTRMGEQFKSATPWFAEVSLGGVHLGEDMTFCVRAVHCNSRPYCAPNIEVKHYKPCVLDPEQMKD